MQPEITKQKIRRNNLRIFFICDSTWIYLPIITRLAYGMSSQVASTVFSGNGR